MSHSASPTVALAGNSALLFNLLGYPAGTLVCTTVGAPGGTDSRAGRHRIERPALHVEGGSAGFPISVQLAGRPGREDQVLAVMRALEAMARSGPVPLATQ